MVVKCYKCGATVAILIKGSKLKRGAKMICAKCLLPPKDDFIESFFGGVFGKK